MDKSNGKESLGAAFNSSNNYTLVIQKESYPGNKFIAPKYEFFLSTNIAVGDSNLKDTQSIKLQLLDGTIVTYDSITFYNVRKDFCRTVGYRVFLNEDQVRVFESNPIASITVSNSLTALFNNRQQKKQKKIVNCLLLGKYFSY